MTSSFHIFNLICEHLLFSSNNQFWQVDVHTCSTSNEHVSRTLTWWWRHEVSRDALFLVASSNIISTPTSWQLCHENTTMLFWSRSVIDNQKHFMNSSVVAQLQPLHVPLVAYVFILLYLFLFYFSLPSPPEAFLNWITWVTTCISVSLMMLPLQTRLSSSWMVPRKFIA